jgi:hypothetical protein
MRCICRDAQGFTRPHRRFFASERGLDLAFQQSKRFLEVVPVGGWAAAGGNVHVDQAIPAVGVVAGEQDRVGVTDEADVRKALVCVGPRDLEGALWIVRGNRRGGSEVTECSFMWWSLGSWLTD